MCLFGNVAGLLFDGLRGTSLDRGVEAWKPNGGSLNIFDKLITCPTFLGSSGVLGGVWDVIKSCWNNCYVVGTLIAFVGVLD